MCSKTATRLFVASAALALGPLAMHARAESATIMLVVVSASSLTTEEASKKAMLEGWGYSVVTISATAAQAKFDSVAAGASCAYISETVQSSDVDTKLTGATMGVVNEEAALSDEFGFSSSMTTFSDTQINIVNTSHYITSTFASGARSIFTSAQPVRYLSGALGGITTLGRQVSTSNPTFAILARGDALTPSGTAAGKRVYLPFGNTGYLPGALTADGQTIMKRSIEWALLPVAHWKLDNGSGSTATDWIGGHNGTLVGPTWTTGKISGAAKFNGASDYITIADHQDFHVTSALTIAGWIKASGWNADSNWASTILRKGDANPNNWNLYINQGKVKLSLDDYDVDGIAGSSSVPTGKWNHVAATWDGSTVKVYLNGALDMTPVARTGTISTDSRDVYLGGRIGSTDVVNGLVDDVRFYNRCLTPAEIAALAAVSPVIQSWKQTAPP